MQDGLVTTVKVNNSFHTIPPQKVGVTTARAKRDEMLFAPNLFVSTSACAASQYLFQSVQASPQISFRLDDYFHRRHDTPRKPHGARFAAASSHHTRTLEECATHHFHRDTTVLVADHVSAAIASCLVSLTAHSKAVVQG